jgi:hypothetical protein
MDGNKFGGFFEGGLQFRIDLSARGRNNDFGCLGAHLLGGETNNQRIGNFLFFFFFLPKKSFSPFPMNYLNQFQPQPKTFNRPSQLFNENVPNRRRDIVNNTTHTLDNHRQSRYEHDDVLSMAKDPSLRDFHAGLDAGVRDYSSSRGIGVTPSNVGLENTMLRQPIQSFALHNLNPQVPLFFTMPDLSKGSVDPTLENRIKYGVRQPMEKRRTTLPDTSSELDQRLGFERGYFNNGAIHEVYGRNIQSSIPEDHMRGFSQYGEHTRLAKFQNQAR